MITELEKEGPSVPEALDAALEEMGVQQDAVEYEVVAEPGRRIFGVGGAKMAKVRVWLKPETIRTIQHNNEDNDAEEEAAPQLEVRAQESVELSDEELDQIADAATQVIKDITKCYGVEPEIEEYEGDDGEIILDIIGDDLGLLIGRHGKTLEALQVIVGAVTHRKTEQHYPVQVDISGYRHRRRLKVEEIARSAAERAVRQDRAVELRPMTSFERKIVHVALRSDTRVSTGSEGDESFRHVVVKPR